ncbi:M23 family metallopeptidase [Neisseria zalophi]|uniref:M23 family peptidase n=1 Tax=Neisseria zalophi TaxID=640030 RepID=A0A5J6PSE1_9NEIS|nr:M23 family metallopeptidase [Neisseria zalophi]QEY25204.1 M23 family peptidase [Neisseria zalophi]
MINQTLKQALCIGAVLAVVAGCQTQNYSRPGSDLAALRAQPAPTAGSLINPVKGHRFTDTWGAARSHGRRHEGVDIFAKKGTPVRSTTDGIVTRIGNNRLGGKVVGIQGPGAWHYYAHLSKFANIKRYQRVKAGTVIGYVGNSGNAKNTPSHLHYGVYLPKGAINPYPLINPNK